MSEKYTKGYSTDSDSSTGSTVGQIHEILNEIQKNNRLDKLNTREDIAKMADHCTNMIVKMKGIEKGSKINKDTKFCPERHSGDGDRGNGSEEFRKGSVNTLSPGCFEEKMANQMRGLSLQEFMKKKKERPKFGDIYNAKLAERMKNKLKMSSQELENVPGKSGSWKGTKNPLKSDNSDSSESDLSSDSSAKVAIDRKIYQTALSKGKTKKQIHLKDTSSEEDLNLNLKQERKNVKLQELMKMKAYAALNDPTTIAEGERYTSSKNDYFPTKEHLKKNQELIKSRLNELSKPKVREPPKKTPATKTPLKKFATSSTVNETIKRVNNATLSLPSTRKNVQKNKN